MNYIEEVAQIMSVRARGASPVAMIHTYGCQQNVADSEKIKGQLEQMGFSFTDAAEEADLILFNTCAIREHAEDRAVSYTHLDVYKRQIWNRSVLSAY